MAVAWNVEDFRTAVAAFAMVSIGGLAAVIAGSVTGGNAQYWLWGAAILLDVIAASVAGQQKGFNVHVEHFTERHRLFVIIALGETLIVTGAGLTGVEWSTELITLAIISVAITFGLWWSYFPRAKPALDKACEGRSGTELAQTARDVFTIMHFPMLGGIVLIAVVFEEVLAHPGDALHLESRLALAAGLLLFVGGMSGAMWRATGRPLLGRVVVIGVAAVMVSVIGDVHPIVTMGLGVAGIALSQILEHFTGLEAEEPADLPAIET